MAKKKKKPQNPNNFQYNLLFKTVCRENTSLDAEYFTDNIIPLALPFFQYFQDATGSLISNK